MTQKNYTVYFFLVVFYRHFSPVIVTGVIYIEYLAFGFAFENISENNEKGTRLYIMVFKGGGGHRGLVIDTSYHLSCRTVKNFPLSL